MCSVKNVLKEIELTFYFKKKKVFMNRHNLMFHIKMQGFFLLSSVDSIDYNEC